MTSIIHPLHAPLEAFLPVSLKAPCLSGPTPSWLLRLIGWLC